MKKLVDGDRWNDRWWRKHFDKDMVIVACWLWDKADKAGFVELDFEDLAEEGYLSLSEAMEAYDRLCKAINGYHRLFTREGDSPHKKRVWIRNYIKVQIGGMDFRRKDLKKAPPVWIGIAKVLLQREDEFPEVKAYKGYASLSKPIIGYDSPNRIRKNKKEKNSSFSSGSGGVPTAKTGGEFAEKAHAFARELYDQMKAEGRGLHQNNITIEGLTHMVGNAPDMDWRKIVNYAIGKDLNEGVRDTYFLLGRLSMDHKYRLPTGVSRETADLQAEYEAEMEKLRNAYDHGKLGETECEEKVQALDAKYKALGVKT